jgi:YVTN family beta-propeller protein
MRAFASRGLILIMLAGLVFVAGCKQVVGGLPPCPTCAPGITALPLGALNRLYDFQLLVNDQTSNDWVVASGTLPAGITLARNGQVSGTPTETGIFNFVVNVTNGGQINTAAITMEIADALALSSTTLPSGFLSTAYTQSLLATGGIPGHTWTVTTPGTDPPGLDITNAGPGNAAYGGIPTLAGLYTFTVRITDAGNAAVLPASITGQITLAIFGEPAAFVVNDGAPGSVQVVDITDPAFPTLGTIGVENNPREITFSPDATRAFVTNMGSDSLSIINTVDLNALAINVSLGAGAQPLGVVAPNNSPFVLTADQGNNTLSIIDYTLGTPAVVGTVSIPFPNSGPTGLAATPDGRLVFASLINEGKVIVLNIDPGLPAFHSIIAVLDIKTEPSNLAFPAGPSGLGYSPGLLSRLLQAFRLVHLGSRRDPAGSPRGRGC